MNIIKKISFPIILTIILLSIFNTPNFRLLNAQSVQNLGDSSVLLNESAEGIGYDTGKEFDSVVGQIIKVILSLVGILFLIYVIIGGIEWMTAGGNEERVTKAKTRIKNGTNGLLIILGAYMITYFIIDIILKETLR